MSRKRFEQRFGFVFAETGSTAQYKKPRVVRGFGHAHVAISKLVLVILAERVSLTIIYKHLINMDISNYQYYRVAICALILIGQNLLS